MDREIQTTPDSSLSMPGWGKQTISALHHNCYHFGKEMQAGNASHKYPLISSILRFLHRTWHPSILPHLSSPRAHLCLPKLHTKSAGVQVHSKGCSKDSDPQPANTLLHTRPRLDNHPLTSTLPSAKGGRLCFKGSVLKREEYFPMKNQHPHKTKS